MVKQYHVEGYEAFKAKVEELESLNEKIVVMFCGSADAEGVSWCGDCVKAEPVVKQVLEKYQDKEDIHFVHVGVGQRDFWKDPECVFRKDSSLMLTSVPTVLTWKGPQRLEEDEVADETLLELVFEE